MHCFHLPYETTPVNPITTFILQCLPIPNGVTPQQQTGFDMWLNGALEFGVVVKRNLPIQNPDPHDQSSWEFICHPRVEAIVLYSTAAADLLLDSASLDLVGVGCSPVCWEPRSFHITRKVGTSKATVSWRTGFILNLALHA